MYTRKCEPGCTCVRHTLRNSGQFGNRPAWNKGLKYTGTKHPPGCTCKIHEGNGSRKCQPGCTCKRHQPRIVSDELRRRLSLARKGKATRTGAVLSQETKDKIGNANRGRVVGPEERQRRSLAVKQSEKFQAIDFALRNKTWRENLTIEERKAIGAAISIGKQKAHRLRGNAGDGNIVPIEFSYILREEIKFRDGYHCVMCWASDKTTTLLIHHIDQDRENNDWSNLVTLCRPCHNRGHNLGYWPIDLKSKAVKFNYQNSIAA
jgi:hypothetical protein